MEEKARMSYHSDLTDEQWEEKAPLYTGMRSCRWSKRELTDAVLYLVDSGCKWRQYLMIFHHIQQYTAFIAALGPVGCGIKFWNKKDQSITDLSGTDSIPILSPDPSPFGGAAATPPERKRKEAATQSAVEIYREIIMENISYDIALALGTTTAGCIAATRWKCSQAVSGSPSALSTAKTGISSVFAPRI